MSGHDLSNVAGFVISISSSKIVANTGVRRYGCYPPNLLHTASAGKRRVRSSDGGQPENLMLYAHA